MYYHNSNVEFGEVREKDAKDLLKRLKNDLIVQSPSEHLLYLEYFKDTELILVFKTIRHSSIDSMSFCAYKLEIIYDADISTD